MKKTVSVIVPVYNINEQYLQECIESILSQDYEDIQLLLINDGSVNGAPGVCESFASKDSRVVYLSQENQGVSVARNNGLDHATGDYVLFVDGDDFLSAGIVKTLVDRMEESETKGKRLDILFYGYCTSYTNREMIRVIDNPDPALFTASTLQLAILHGNPRLGPLEVGAPWGKLIRRSVIEDNHVRYTKGLKKGQDTVFTLGLLENCKNISYESVAGYHYRISSASISHRFNENIVEIMEKTLKAYGDFVEKNKKGQEFEIALANKHYRVLIGEYMDLYYVNHNNPKTSKELQKEYMQLLEREPYSQAIDKVDSKSLGLLDKFEYSCVKKRRLQLLWMEKKLLAFARGLIVKNYG